MSFCGMRKPRPLRRRKEDKGKGKSVQPDDEAAYPGPDVRDSQSRQRNGHSTSNSYRQSQSNEDYEYEEYDPEYKRVLLRRHPANKYDNGNGHSTYNSNGNSTNNSNNHSNHNNTTKNTNYNTYDDEEAYWAREDQLSTILEQISISESSRRNTPNPNFEATATTNNSAEPNNHLHSVTAVGSASASTSGKWDPPTFVPKFASQAFKKTRFVENVFFESSIPEDRIPLIRMSFSNSGSGGRKTPETPRSIAPPPRDLEAIARIDKSLIFEHFTTNDAWELGSALRNRLLPLPAPVVISISLANQNQILFHTCTHSGVMPDNDNWVSRKRATVLRWGCSTWYMHCKFNGDEAAFRDKYGLGNGAGEYAIHGGGVPIRVTGVEGVVAVVVVSGLKQDEDHGVIVEVIRELYY